MELEDALNQLALYSGGTLCLVLPGPSDAEEEDISILVDRTPIMLGRDAPAEVMAEVSGKVGCRYICIGEEGKGVGVVIKKRILMFMEEMSNREGH